MLPIKIVTDSNGIVKAIFLNGFDISAFILYNNEVSINMGADRLPGVTVTLTGTVSIIKDEMYDK